MERPRALRFLTPAEHAAVVAAADVLVPPTAGHPGGGALGVADYVDTLLGAFTFDPPRIWAGGPFSGRAGGAAGFDRFLTLTPLEELAWRTRLEGSRGQVEREWNGPVRGWQEVYRAGLAALGAGFAVSAPADRVATLDAVPELRDLCYEHACEACYGAPEYGGNPGGAGWAAIAFPGDVQPRGWTPAEVRGDA